MDMFVAVEIGASGEGIAFVNPDHVTSISRTNKGCRITFVGGGEITVGADVDEVVSAITPTLADALLNNG